MRLPYGSILPRGVENLLVRGRCVSAEEEAMGQIRLWSVCSVSGQTAGTAPDVVVKKTHGPLHTSLRTSSDQQVSIQRPFDSEWNRE